MVTRQDFITKQTTKRQSETAIPSPPAFNLSFILIAVDDDRDNDDDGACSQSPVRPISPISVSVYLFPDGICV